jgi:hypothetical protein
MNHESTLFKSLNYNQYIILIQKITIKKNTNSKIYELNHF